ncbi:topoisomerase II-associated protein PAT1 [Paraphysoderma sedebokerense]|nr:topoisomerase II-associated protein PAT1 [Paraphysoderma sedebokerense]KAI9140406.1 topoisomerase II-associated protein PAT1 [Paraphysoderma sedebokerense]
MSFFGFDTSLPPEDREAFKSAQTNRPNSNSVDAKLESLTLDDDGAYIYDESAFGDRIDNEYQNDDDILNDETFGVDVTEVSKDFDFSGSTASAQGKLFNDLSDSRYKTPAMNIQANASSKDGFGITPTGSFGRTAGESMAIGGYSFEEETFDKVLSRVEAQSKKQKESRQKKNLWAPPSSSSTIDTSLFPTPLQYSYAAAASQRTSGQEPLSLEELEAQLIQQSRQKQQMLQMQQFQPGISPQQAVMTVEELEKQLLQKQMIAKDEQEKAAKRAARERKAREMAKYNNLMTQYEKDLIARIQISQLVSADPFGDDFYYQVYTVLRGQSASQQALTRSSIPPLLLRESYSRGGRRDKNNRGPVNLDTQIQKIVDQARKKPKATQFGLEGALGKIAINSVKNPKQILQVTASQTTSESASETPKRSTSQASLGGPTRLAGQAVLKSIETVYNCVLELEQLKRQPPSDKAAAEEEIKWNENIAKFTAQLVDELKLDVEVPFGQIHPIVDILSYGKGNKIIARAIRFLDASHQQSLLNAILQNTPFFRITKASVSLCVHSLPHLFPSTSFKPPTISKLSTMVEDLETFMNFVVPPVVSYVSDSSWDVILAAMERLLKSWISTGSGEPIEIVKVCMSKVGLALLTVLLSRAEILKQSAEPEDPSVARWSILYNALFTALQGQFITLFPPSTIPILPSPRGTTEPALPINVLQSYISGIILSYELHFFCSLD